MFLICPLQLPSFERVLFELISSCSSIDSCRPKLLSLQSWWLGIPDCGSTDPSMQWTQISRYPRSSVCSPESQLAGTCQASLAWTADIRGDVDPPQMTNFPDLNLRPIYFSVQSRCIKSVGQQLFYDVVDCSSCPGRAMRSLRIPNRMRRSKYMNEFYFPAQFSSYFILNHFSIGKSEPSKWLNEQVRRESWV